MNTTPSSADHVMTLIAAPGAPLTTAAVEAVRQAVAAQGSARAGLHWLASGVACDLPLGPDPDSSAEAAAHTALNGAPVDVVVQPAAGRRKRLLLADMDSTIIAQECLDQVAVAVGLGPQISAITRRAMAGELDFAQSLRARTALLAGTDASVLEQVWRDKITLTPGASALTAAMRGRGGVCALISGGFTFFADRVAAAAGFTHSRANTLLIRNGRLTGDVTGPVMTPGAKRTFLEDMCSHLGLDPQDTMAVGDGANDLEMITAAGLGVAFHAKPILAQAAAARINHADLTALLHLQGP